MVVIKIILVVVLLVAMVMVLLGIGHLFSGNFNTGQNEIDELRREVLERDEVISPKNSFHDFVGTRARHQRARH